MLISALSRLECVIEYLLSSPICTPAWGILASWVRSPHRQSTSVQPGSSPYGTAGVPAGKHAHNAHRAPGGQARLLPPHQQRATYEVLPRGISARRSALVLLRTGARPGGGAAIRHRTTDCCPVAGLARSFIYRLPLVAAAVGAKVLRGCPLTSPVRARTIFQWRRPLD